jgi:hypothetical protein
MLPGLKTGRHIFLEGKNLRIREPRFLLMSQNWVRAFFISHISGWFIACLQTLWIVWEVRRLGKKKKNERT